MLTNRSNGSLLSFRSLSKGGHEDEKLTMPLIPTTECCVGVPITIVG